MNTDAFQLLVEDMELSERTIRLIETIRSSPPSRRVKSGGRNVPGRYPSSKMGVTIQFESHTLELANVYSKEHDPNVIEYYDQPPSFPIQYKIEDKHGMERNSGHLYTADYFVIEKEWVGWEECKKEDELIRLAIEYPNRYLLDSEGMWRCPPAEAYANEQGLSFRIISDKDLNRTYLRNIVFLEDYLLNEKNDNDIVNEKIIDTVSQNPGILLELLIREYSIEADHIYDSIIKNQIYVDLHNKVLAEAHNIELYIDKTTSQAYQNISNSYLKKEISSNVITVEVGSSIQWDGNKWTIINVGESEYSLLNNDKKLITMPENIFMNLVKEGKISGVIEKASPSTDLDIFKILLESGKDQLEAANRRFQYVMRLKNGEQVNDVPSRTAADWLKKYSDAEQIYGNGFIGLVDSRVNQGNHNPRFLIEIMDTLDKYIDQYYETIVQRNRRTVYSLFLDECNEKGWTAPSYRTFCDKVKNHSTKWI